MQTLPSVFRFSGLSPQWVGVIGKNYSREEIKDSFFHQGLPLTTEALFDLPTFCLRILIPNQPSQVLSPQARQLVYSELLDHPTIAERLPLLTQLRYRRGFSQRLDRAIQADRGCA